MTQDIKTFAQKYFSLLSRAISAGIVLLWIIGQFFPPVQNWIISKNILTYLAVVLIMEVINLLMDIQKSLEKKLGGIHKDQSNSMSDVYRFLGSFNGDKQARKVDMLEYSTHTVGNLLEKLEEGNWKIRLLLKNPESTGMIFQTRRIEQEMKNLKDEAFKNYTDVEIRLYQQPASLRGRNFANTLLNIGWYTYLPDPSGVCGHKNPMITTTTDTEQGKVLQDFFQRTFEDLWNSPSTKTLEQVG